MCDDGPMLPLCIDNWIHSQMCQLGEPSCEGFDHQHLQWVSGRAVINLLGPSTGDTILHP